MAWRPEQQNVQALFALGHRTTEDHVLNLDGVKRRDPPKDLANRGRRHVIRPSIS
jgi:hypothetical protein